jgi:hypothetical protein
MLWVRGIRKFGTKAEGGTAMFEAVAEIILGLLSSMGPNIRLKRKRKREQKQKAADDFNVAQDEAPSGL